jgi:uncharacterized protein (DUF885 family)
MKYPRLLLASLLVLASSASFADANGDFATLLDEHWEWQMSTSPVWASSMGDRRYNDQWSDQSLTAIEKRHTETRDFLRRAYAIDRKALSTEDQLNYELFRRQLQESVDDHQFNAHLMPFSHRGGIQNPENTISRLRLVTLKDYEDWLARVEKLDDVIDQQIKLAEEGRKRGMISPKILLQRITDQLALQVVEFASESPLFKAFDEMPESFSAADRERLRSAATDALEDKVLPAYRKLDKYFNQKYLPAARDSFGVSGLPNGSAWY